MQFNSIEFMCFFPVVLGIYFVIPGKCRRVWLLIASYYFYMGWNPKYVFLIATSTIVTYFCGILLEKYNIREKKRIQKIIFIICLVINLGILGVFKYADFVIDTINSILRHIHIVTIKKKFDLLLPVGISFYTFQALGYIIDVYRGEVKAEKNLINYALFVSFFPQLVAGPIERSKNLLSQVQNIANIKLWNEKRITSGAIRMVWGLFMKMVIADRVAILVNNVFDNYRMYGSTELVIAAIGFSIQIYCDFSSYSMIAIGAAQIMGIELMENFNAPYMAGSIREFWGRWHISLSTWFKDYLYIPLGGNRRGKLRKIVNWAVVFWVSGLWHGAEWSFVVWGGVHAFAQTLEEITVSYREKLINKLKIKTKCFSWKLLRVLYTYIIVVFAWIFFRADTITDALRFVKRIFIRPTPWLFFNGGIFTLGLDRIEMNILVFSVCILFVVDLIKYRRRVTIDVFLMEQNLWFEWVCVIGLILMIFIFGEYGPAFDAQQFIYFQF